MPLANPYVATGYVAESYIGARGVLQAKLQEITWNDFAESQYIDRTWDEWYGDAWDFDAVAFTLSTASKALGGYLQKPVITPTAQTTLSGLAKFVAAGIATPVATSTQSSNAARFCGLVDANYTGIFGVDANAYAINFAEAGWVASFTTAFNGNFSKLFYPSLSAAFTQDADANYVISAGKGAWYSTFTHDTNGNYLIVRADALFEAFAFELTNADKILQVDPYLTYKVLREKRVLSVGIELRVIEALQETRLNSIKAESTVYLAPQETRLYKIMVPPIKYRSNVPRVRQDS